MSMVGVQDQTKQLEIKVYPRRIQNNTNCMHQPVISWGNACSTWMHWPVMCTHQPVTSQADACTYCMGSKASSLSRIYLYSSYFGSRLIFKQGKTQNQFTSLPKFHKTSTFSKLIGLKILCHLFPSD